MRRFTIHATAIPILLVAMLWFVGGTTYAQDATPTPEEEATMSSRLPDIPYLSDWSASAHADITAEAFVHWNEDDPPEVSSRCARCHSTPGYQDYLGVDGSAFGVVDTNHITGTTVECVACHNPIASSLVSVTFPSEITIDVSNASARCMVCHQGRAASASVVTAIAEAGLADEPDTPSEDLSFINIHYYAAAASLYGGEAQGGFQYPDQRYQGKFEHVPGVESCVDCHQPHSLQVKVDTCADCHEGVAAVEDLRDVRMNGSLRDYDGDGDIEEGIYYELEGLREKLAAAISAYSTEILDKQIIYNPASHPYFFVDSNENGEPDADDERYSGWSPRLLEAAYNYQTSLKDPGAFVHNAKYHIQLLHDSIASLNEAIAEPIDMSLAQRNDAGHFNSTAEAFLHFSEEDGPTQAGCAKCHSATGLPFFLEHGVSIAQPSSGSLACSTCHNDLKEFTVYEIPEVTFPSGATVSFGEDSTSNTCLNCHQGRESSFSVKAAIIRADVGPDDISDQLRFLNPHYFAAGATLFGGEASGAAEYDGKEYVGRNEHIRRFDTCTECHNVHSLEVQTVDCADCHESETLEEIRDEDNVTDWDGDGDATEGLASEIATLHKALLQAIQVYGAETIGTPITYAPANYPYWYIDANENGMIDDDELTQEGRYPSWTPTLLRAAYNYQYVAKDPGAFAHNGAYVLQILYDSLESIGGADAVVGMTRPTLDGLIQ
jgi:hypothetical protein